jgi:CheY-like chemotaxis protein
MSNRPVILVVEDEIPVQTTLCATLTLVGFNALRADSVDAALKTLGAEHIDAVILDVRLPDPKGLQRSGLTLLAFLRATPDYAHIPALIFTGVPLSGDEELLAKKHDAQVFYKPQAYSTLIATLSRMLAYSPTV